MLANFEQRSYKDYGRVWIGRYRNLHNLAHWHLETELIYVEKGNVLISYNDEQYSLTEGDIAFINSEQVHYIDGDEHSIVQIIMYDADFLPDNIKACRLSHVLLTATYPFSTTFFLIQEEQKMKDHFYVEKIHLLLENLLLDIYRKEDLVQEDNANKNENIHDYKKLLRKIQRSYQEITFSQAAAMMGLSDSYFSRYFHKMSGMTFSRYLNTIRIEKAMEMLKEDRYTVTEISYRCGFETIRHFNRVFKEITGMTPRQMPKDFMLYHHTTKMLHDSFDPTLKDSILL